MMDGQTLAARPRACSQQARFGYVCRNDEQVFKESFHETRHDHMEKGLNGVG